MTTVAPASDVSGVGWTASAGGALYQAVDEASPDDADFISSPISPLSGTEAVTFGLASPIPAGTHTIRVRSSTTLGAASMRARLLDGADLPVGSSAWQTVTTTPTTYPLTVITSGTATRVRVEILPTYPLNVLALNSTPIALDGLFLSLNSTSIPAGTIHYGSDPMFFGTDIVSFT